MRRKKVFMRTQYFSLSHKKKVLMGPQNFFFVLRWRLASEKKNIFLWRKYDWEKSIAWSAGNTSDGLIDRATISSNFVSDWFRGQYLFFFYTNHEALSDKHTFTSYYRHRTENCSTRRIRISKCSSEYSLLQHTPLEEIFFLLKTGLIVGPGTFSYFCWVLCVGVVTVVGGR